MTLTEIAYHYIKGKGYQRVEDIFRFKDRYFIRVRRDEYEPKLYDADWLNDADNNIWGGDERLIKTEETPCSEQEELKYWENSNKRDLENYEKLKHKNKK